MQKLCLVDSSSEISEPVKRREAPQLRKRKYAELDRCWEMDSDSRENCLIAYSDVQSSKS
jgi:hypothetical protein